MSQWQAAGQLINDLMAVQLQGQYRTVLQKATKFEQKPQACKQLINDIKGIANCRLGLYKEAAACYRKALNISNNSNYKNNLALTLYHLGENQEAKRLLQQAINVMNNPIYILNLAKVQEKLGNTDQAQKYLQMSEQVKSFKVDSDDTQNGLIFNFLWQKEQLPSFGFALINEIDKNTGQARTKIKEKLGRQRTIELKDQIFSLINDIQGRIYKLQKWSSSRGFKIPKKTLILKLILQQFSSALKNVENELSHGVFTHSQNEKHIQHFLDGFRETIDNYITLRQNPSQADQDSIIQSFIYLKRSVLSAIKKANAQRVSKTPRQNDQESQQKKKKKIQIIRLQSSDEDSQIKKTINQEYNPSCEKRQIINKLSQIIKSDILMSRSKPPEPNCQDDIRKFNEIRNFWQQVKAIKGKQQCEWQLYIQGSEIQCAIAKPSKEQQFEKTIIFYYKPQLSKIMSSLQRQNNCPVKKFYDTLIWVIKLVEIVNGGTTKIKFKENGISKQITVENLIHKMGYIINEISNYKKQEKLCQKVLKTIAEIFRIFAQDFSDRIEKIEQNIKILNENFDAIKQNVFDQTVFKKLQETKILSRIANDHNVFRGNLFQDTELSQEDQTAVQNVVVALIYSQRAQRVKDIDLIGILLEQCFTREAPTQKELIISKVSQKMKQIKEGAPKKILSLFKLFNTKKQKSIVF